jgi:5-formyltetrahydrofolate cyclo-ligase
VGLTLLLPLWLRLGLRWGFSNSANNRTMEPSAINAAKKAVRSALRKTLQAISVDALTSQSEAACRNAALQPWFSRARTVSLFLSMPAGEVQTRSLLAASFAAGKDVFVPVAGAAREDMPVVHISHGENFAIFPLDAWKIPVPPPYYTDAAAAASEAPPRRKIFPQQSGPSLGDAPIDVVFVPGLVFSPRGARLGHGKGYYGEPCCLQ